MPSTVEIPVLPLRDVVAFPLLTLPLLVGRAKTLRACESALSQDWRILLIAQRDAAVEVPSIADLYGLGTIAVLIEHLPLPEGRMKLLVRVERRARIVRFDETGVMAVVEPIDDPDGAPAAPNLPAFSLSDWAAEGPANIGVHVQRRVAKLQCILEDEALTPTERLRAGSALLTGG
jgi:ATP-dependent Lon protease